MKNLHDSWFSKIYIQYKTYNMQKENSKMLLKIKEEMKMRNVILRLEVKTNIEII